jgi:hypothetical protein
MTATPAAPVAKPAAIRPAMIRPMSLLSMVFPKIRPRPWIHNGVLLALLPTLRRLRFAMRPDVWITTGKPHHGARL